MKNKIASLAMATVAAIASVSLVAGCSTLESLYNSPGNQKFLAALQKQVTILGPVAVVALTDYLAGGGNLSNAQGAQIGAYAATAEVQALVANGASKQALSQAIAESVTVYSGDPKFKTPALDLAKIAVASLPSNPTPQQAAAATNAVGVALAGATNPNG